MLITYCINVTNQQIVHLKSAQCYMSVPQLKKTGKKNHIKHMHIYTQKQSTLVLLSLGHILVPGLWYFLLHCFQQY